MKKSISAVLFFVTMTIVSLFAINAYALDETDVFEINAENTIVSSVSDVTYNGLSQTPKITVLTADENGSVSELIKDVDYTVSYSNNKNAGTASIKVSGIGDYTGDVSKSFKIKPYSISRQSGISTKLAYTTCQYSGKAKTPTVYLTYTYNRGKSKVSLKKDVDFKLTYFNNINPGKACVKITGIGNFSGSYSKTYNIAPAKVKGVRTYDRTTSAITASWSSQKNISGYDVAIYDSAKKKYKHLAYVSPKSSKYRLLKLKAGTVYKIKVRAYKTVDNKKIFGYYSDSFAAVTKPSKITLVSVTKSGSTLQVEWKKVKCSGYEIMYSTDKNMKKGVKTIRVNGSSKTSAKIKNISKKKRYYVKVRAFVKYDNKYYYGDRSSTLSSYYSNLYATYTSYYENNPNRTTNLRIASKKISGTVIGAGKTFSFNKVVGPRTKAKGYKDAHIFTGGGVSNGLGGGICQVASTMFNCALKANVKITERHQHSQRVAYVPLGRDAAIFGTAQDFKWTNNTKYPMRVVMTVKDGKITCSFYTSQKVKPPKVTLKVKKKGNNFKMTRSVKGKVNYSCKSKY